jgi:transcriptional regulator with XRE-family HTH domain
MMTMIEIGARVRKARKQAGLSQVELAKLCNVTQATVQKIETNRSANSKFLAKIWSQLNLPLEEIGIKVNGAAVAIENDDNRVDRQFDQFEDLLIDFLRQVRTLRKQMLQR